MFTTSYDANGNVLTVSHPGGTITRTYDALNRVTTCTEGGKTIGYEYDAAGNLKKLIYPDSGGDFLRRFCRFLEELGIGAQGELAQAGNFLRMLHTVREERALKLSNQFYASVVPAVDGYVSKPLTYSGQPAMPQVSVYALMPAGRVRSMAANRFIDFFVRQVLCAEPAGMA